MRNFKSDTSVRHCDIIDLMQPLTDRTRASHSEANGDDVVVEGQFNLRKLRSGLILHATDSVEKSTQPVRIEHNPCLSLFLILEGGIEFEVEDKQFCFGNPSGLNKVAQPEGWLLSLTEQTSLLRKSNPGTRTQKIFISVEHSWFQDDLSQPEEELKDILAFSEEHLACTKWIPSMRAVSLAGQILRPPEMAPFLKNMYLESRAMEIAVEAFQSISDRAAASQRGECPTRKMLQTQAAKNYIDKHLDCPLTLEDIANHVHSSISSLQRHFKAAYGTTVVDYVRARKLALAREAIEKEGMSVSEAAFVAGYTTASSFTTAFKRAYGISPGTLRT